MQKGGDQTTTDSTSSLPKELAPYYKDLFSRAQGVSKQPYTAYEGQRLTDFSPDTNAAFDLVRGVAREGTPWMDQAAQAAQGIAGYQASPITAASTAPSGVVSGGTVNPMGPAQYTGVNTNNITSQSVSPMAQAAAAAAAGRVSTGNFDFSATPDADIASYMSPYTQNVLDVQRRRAEQAFQEQQAGRDAAAVAAGAFGGDRRFVADSLAQRDLNQQLQDMDATGLAAAFDRATGLFQSDEARRLSAYDSDAARKLAADTGNVERGLAASQFDIGTRLAADTSNADRGLEAARLTAANRLAADTGNADRRLAASQFDITKLLEAQTGNVERGLQAGQFNINTRLASDQANADRGLSAAIASEDARRAGAGLGLDAATQLGAFEEARRGLDMSAAEALSGVGSKIQQRDQAGLDQAYNDFINQRDWPAQQLSLYSQLLSGAPVNPSTTTTTTEPAPDFLSQLIGAGTGIAGIMKLLNGGI